MGKLVIPERDILAACLNRLWWWKSQGVVVHYERRTVRTWTDGRNIKLAESGTPDITTYVKHNGICSICFFEVKRSNVNITLGPKGHQLAFMLRFKDLTNVYYDLINHPSMVDQRIENITNHTDTIFNNMNLDV